MHRTLLIAGVVVLGGGLTWWLTRPDDAQLIRKEWNQVLRLCQKENGVSLLSAATRPLELQSHFTSNAIIEIGAPYPLSLRRPELPSVFGRIWHLAERITVNSRGEDLFVAASRQTADMEVTVEAQAVVRGETVSGLDAYRISWTRSEGPWRMEKVQRMDTIRNPAAATY